MDFLQSVKYMSIYLSIYYYTQGPAGNRPEPHHGGGKDASRQPGEEGAREGASAASTKIHVTTAHTV